ncbi:MAG: DUF4249 family protein [Bacteroidota bacterium]
MRIFRTFSILLLAVAFSCLDKIDLETPKGLDDSVEIRGELVMGDPAEITVFLERVFNFDISSFSVIRAQSVLLIDEAGNSVEVPFRQDGVHFYRFSDPNDPVKIEFDRQYKIRVGLFDGRVFESDFEVMTRPVQGGQLQARPVAQQRLDPNGDLRTFDVVGFSVDAPLLIKETGTYARLHWVPERTFKVTDSMLIPDFVSKTCYITTSIDLTGFYLFDGTTVKADSINRFGLSDVSVNYEFAEGYYYTIFQRSLSEGSFNYWRQIQQVFAADGNIFSAPVGRISSNIKNVDDPSQEAFGYFSAFSQDTLRLYVSPEEVSGFGFDVTKACPRPPVEGRPCPLSVCCDCAGEVGSQTTVPDFWVE